ncbi:hypothetical protein GCM10027040_36300 [Halomonas shantousis]
MTTKNGVTKKSDYYVSKKDITPQKHNPWSKELVHSIEKGYKITGFASSNHTLINNDTGECSDAGAIIGTRKTVDKEEFVKFFGAGLVEAFSLSKTAKDVFLTILHAYIEKNTIAGRPDQIYVNHTIAKEEFGYTKSRATFTSGLNELCLKEFMAPVENRDGFYWLNPNLFYKGDRMMIVKEYVVTNSKGKKPLKGLTEQEQLEMMEDENESNR